VFTAVAGLRSTSLSMNMSQIDVTTNAAVTGAVVRRVFLAGGIQEITISGEGVADTAATLKTLMTKFLAGTETNFEVLWTDVGTLAAGFVITSFEPSGEVEGALLFSITLSMTAYTSWTEAA
jgi:TP901-1 family phage major tail protein